ncbi:MAG TPA: class I SAM-dependent methyltransferase [Streptosporangiaceae bacterium]
MRHAEFNDPALVMVYDAAFGWSRADDFFLSVVNATPAARVVDLGCGTGRLALGLAAAGHTVTGVDPARASLDAARAKPGADRVTWMEGTSAVLPRAAFDVSVMTSHVAQFFVTDEEWRQALADLHRALVPGGRLTFDTRDPRARGWERWNPADSRREVNLPDGRHVTATTEVDAVADGVVSFTIYYAFADGMHLLSTGDLRFRSEDELRSSLLAAGYAVEQIYGGWNREPAGAGDGEFLVIARA